MVRAACLLATTIIALSACSAPRPQSNGADPPAAVACIDASTGQVVPATASRATEFQHAVESGPLFAMLAGQSSLKSCRVEIDDEQTTLDYGFSNGGTLHAERDPILESSSQEAGLASPPGEDPIAILMRAERAAFSASGCGIKWKQAGPNAAVDGVPGALETVYRGDTCNCQARVRRDAAGHVIGLSISSAC